MRLKRRDETHFAVAAHDCFNSDEFKSTISDLQGIELETFTNMPALQSAYVFARHPKHEQQMVFVNRVFFDSYMDFFAFDLFNGLHHGHAPACCQNCGKYFLTQNAHAVRKNSHFYVIPSLLLRSDVLKYIQPIKGDCYENP